MEKIKPKSEKLFHKEGYFYRVGVVSSSKTPPLESCPILISDKQIDHIRNRHSRELSRAQFNGVLEFVKHVVDDFDAVYKGDFGRVLLAVSRPNVSHVAVVELQHVIELGGDYYKIITATTYSTSRLKKKEVLYPKSRQKK